MDFLRAAILSFLDKMTVVTVIDILVVAFLIYQAMMIVRGRRAAQILSGLLLLGLIYSAAVSLGLDLLTTVLSRLAPYTAFALVVIFQSDIRRLLTRISLAAQLGFGARIRTLVSTEEIKLALQNLSTQKTGALLVIEREIGLKTFIESGVRLDARLSHDLIVSLFFKENRLHDGAVIIQGDRIAAAACFLPLATNPNLQGSLGTRHRSALGITEESDCLAIVVSEETGRFSIAQQGDLWTSVPIDMVEKLIQKPDFRLDPRTAVTALPDRRAPVPMTGS